MPRNANSEGSAKRVQESVALPRRGAVDVQHGAQENGAQIARLTEK
jgi:hypothetical protein